MFNSFLSTKGFCYGEISHQVWKKSIRTWLAPIPQAPILLRPGAKRHPTETGRIHRGRNDRKPAIFQGKKCEDLIHKDGRLEILQKWKCVSPKIGICHMCQKTVKHQTVWHDTCIPNCMRISLGMGPTIVGEKVGDVSGYNPAKLDENLPGFEPPKAPKYESQ